MLSWLGHGAQGARSISSIFEPQVGPDTICLAVLGYVKQETMESPASRWSNTLKADNIKIQQLSIHLPIYLSICLFAYLSSSIYLYNPRYTLADDTAALDDLSQLYTQSPASCSIWTGLTTELLTTQLRTVAQIFQRSHLHEHLCLGSNTACHLDYSVM